MATDIVIPTVGESVTSGVISTWRKADGDFVERDEPVLDLETDKITMEITAPAAGLLKRIAREGDEVAVGAVVGSVDETASKPAGQPASPPAGKPADKPASKPAEEARAPAAAQPAPRPEPASPAPAPKPGSRAARRAGRPRCPRHAAGRTDRQGTERRPGTRRRHRRRRTHPRAGCACLPPDPAPGERRSGGPRRPRGPHTGDRSPLDLPQEDDAAPSAPRRAPRRRPAHGRHAHHVQRV
ncbi:MAG: hypothetical protein IPJ41_15965 [Phycisphaerales bacterium]|nr:hypothetical protein [Phycisphaerales bacterium]